MRRDLISLDDSARLVDQVQGAIARKQPLRIRGGDSKAFLGRLVEGEAIDTRSHRGVVSYDPSELVITARAGTPLAELNALLDEAGQMLPCEPPACGESATIGGVVATGLSGPRRPWAGSVRDFLLGCRIVTGEGKHLRFGGQVMKNVAGYDVSRLMSGSFGCLGLLTEVSLKVLPKPRETMSVTLELEASEAMRELSSWRRAALPVSAACHIDGRLHVRLEGGTGSVHAASDRIGGEHLEETFWAELRERRLAFFDDERPLWRLSLPNSAPLVDLPGAVMLDWAGAQRWLKSDASAATIRGIASAAGGHATCFTPNVTADPFHPLAAPLMRFHQQLKQRLDPHGVFNPGRMYADY
ncbi:glycolate oxidase subunit GlcE [Caballeronia ptereochthonis]|uniref:FAD-binding protein n=1 Tax=Caballeronia ptereochthonis TaxID=1777144 RepID=A0A158C3Z2_9BURK|nr:glycolate oxidase subunit GlcE [Caballeronia ptereochthonis]SAK76991.1 FAD-binding protein [Caballeronia ptereochthonis]